MIKKKFKEKSSSQLMEESIMKEQVENDVNLNDVIIIEEPTEKLVTETPMKEVPVDFTIIEEPTEKLVTETPMKEVPVDFTIIEEPKQETSTVQGEFKEILLYRFYHLKLDIEDYNKISSDKWKLYIGEDYKKKVYNVMGVTIDVALGLAGYNIAFANQDDLDYRRNNLVLTPKTK